MHGGRWKRDREINSGRNKEWTEGERGREREKLTRVVDDAEWRVSFLTHFSFQAVLFIRSFLPSIFPRCRYRDAERAPVKSISKISDDHVSSFLIRKPQWIVILEESFLPLDVSFCESDRYSFHELSQCSCTFSNTLVFSSMDGKESRGRRCLGDCNDEARAIFIEIEVAHAMANIRARV